MADATKLVITSEITVAGTTDKVNTTFSEVNPSLTDEQIRTFASTVSTLIRVEPDYYTRTDTTILEPPNATQANRQVYLMRKEGLKNVEITQDGLQPEQRVEKDLFNQRSEN